jgi:uncharacterized membrane protein YidH (DUF202 family)
MPFVPDFLSFLIYLFVLIVVLGLVRPRYVLWFIDRKNRREVLKIYGLFLGMLILLKILVVHYF